MVKVVPGAKLAFHGHGAAVVLDDVVGNGQPKPGPLADGFGGKKRLENLLQGFIRNARPVVGDGQGAPLFIALGRNDDAAFVFDGLGLR